MDILKVHLAFIRVRYMTPFAIHRKFVFMPLLYAANRYAVAKHDPFVQLICTDFPSSNTVARLSLSMRLQYFVNYASFRKRVLVRENRIASLHQLLWLGHTLFIPTRGFHMIRFLSHAPRMITMEGTCP